MLLHEVGTCDSHETALTQLVDPAPVTGSRLLFTTTAYCKGTTIASGVRVRSGIAVAVPAILPLGSIVSITTEDPKYQGIYAITDTGPAVQRHVIDFCMWSCYEALGFGWKNLS